MDFQKKDKYAGTRLDQEEGGATVLIEEPSFNGDRPISSAAHDYLGFEQMAKHLARSICRTDLSNGLVIGIEGPWGSGKSSLLQLTQEAMRAETAGREVISFSPWLVGNRQELLTELLGQLAEAVDASGANTGKELKEHLKNYAAAARGLALLADLAGGGGAFSLFARLGLSTSAKVAEKASESTLFELKRRIQSELGKLGKSYVIVIDDLDRLDPAEAVEVLRLVRSVADFPFVGYILAYDSKVLGESIESAIGAGDGKSYLEKIVQVSYRVPAPQVFDLKAWLESELSSSKLGIEVESSASGRISSTIQEVTSRYIRTPRDVVRLLNAVNLYLGGLRSRIDPGDLIFLQAIRLKFPELYDWIEEYVFALSAVGDWGFLLPNAPTEMGARLLTLMGENENERISYLGFLEDYLPGIDRLSMIRDATTFRVFDGLPADFRATFGAECRLASPNHFRLYFALAEPSGSISDSDLFGFLSLVRRDVASASKAFLEQINTTRPQGGRMAEVFLDRIIERRATISDEDVEPLLLVFGETFDELARVAVPVMGYPDFLRGGRRSPFSLINVVSHERRMVVLDKLFREAPALSWLSGIARTLTQDHGFGGYRGKEDGDRPLTDEEFELVRTTWLRRLAATDPKTLIETPYLLSLLYGWLQAGGKDEVLAWVAKQSATDAGLVTLLLRMRSWVGTSDGGRFPVNRETLSAFWPDAEQVESRLRAISASNESPSRDAKVLLDAIAEGKKY